MIDNCWIFENIKKELISKFLHFKGIKKIKVSLSNLQFGKFSKHADEFKEIEINYE